MVLMGGMGKRGNTGREGKRSIMLSLPPTPPLWLLEKLTADGGDVV
jgi:hypothetical protein